MINIIPVVILFLIIFYLNYNKEKFTNSTPHENIEYLKEKLTQLKEYKKLYNFKNVDGTNASHTLLDNLMYKQALLDSIDIEKKLNEMYRVITKI